jgi:hypothetical protein
MSSMDMVSDYNVPTKRLPPLATQRHHSLRLRSSHRLLDLFRSRALMDNMGVELLGCAACCGTRYDSIREVYCAVE